MSASDLTAREVAAIFGCSRRKITDEASRHGIGYDLGGRAGFRFTEADVKALRAAMAPATAPVGQRTA